MATACNNRSSPIGVGMTPMKEQFDKIGISKVRKTKVSRGTDLFRARTTYPVYLSVVDGLDGEYFSVSGSINGG